MKFLILRKQKPILIYFLMYELASFDIEEHLKVDKISMLLFKFFTAFFVFFGFSGFTKVYCEWQLCLEAYRKNLIVTQKTKKK